MCSVRLGFFCEGVMGVSRIRFWFGDGIFRFCLYEMILYEVIC